MCKKQLNLPARLNRTQASFSSVGKSHYEVQQSLVVSPSSPLSLLFELKSWKDLCMVDWASSQNEKALWKRRLTPIQFSIVVQLFYYYQLPKEMKLCVLFSNHTHMILTLQNLSYPLKKSSCLVNSNFCFSVRHMTYLVPT